MDVQDRQEHCDPKPLTGAEPLVVKSLHGQDGAVGGGDHRVCLLRHQAARIPEEGGHRYRRHRGDQPEPRVPPAPQDGRDTAEKRRDGDAVRIQGHATGQRDAARVSGRGGSDALCRSGLGRGEGQVVDPQRDRVAQYRLAPDAVHGRDLLQLCGG